jgi:hypothetical protein
LPGWKPQNHTKSHKYDFKPYLQIKWNHYMMNALTILNLKLKNDGWPISFVKISNGGLQCLAPTVGDDVKVKDLGNEYPMAVGLGWFYTINKFIGSYLDSSTITINNTRLDRSLRSLLQDIEDEKRKPSAEYERKTLSDYIHKKQMKGFKRVVRNDFSRNLAKYLERIGKE